MHGRVFEWVARIVRDNRLGHLSTLEVGSYFVNGGIAELFTGNYLGVDQRPGPGVDEVADGEHLPYKTGTFSVVVSCDTLEHVRRPWLFVAEMVRVCGMGGWIILTTCDYGFPRHDFPDDFWRFSPAGLRGLLDDCGASVVETMANDGQTIYMAARRLA